MAHEESMAAKRKIAPPKPNDNLPWSELTKAQQNKQYTLALQKYRMGDGPNPSTSGEFSRKQVAAEKNA
jgi:hypothetical protein